MLCLIKVNSKTTEHCLLFGQYLLCVISSIWLMIQFDASYNLMNNIILPFKFFSLLDFRWWLYSFKTAIFLMIPQDKMTPIYVVLHDHFDGKKETGTSLLLFFQKKMKFIVNSVLFDPCPSIRLLNLIESQTWWINSLIDHFA